MTFNYRACPLSANPELPPEEFEKLFETGQFEADTAQGILKQIELKEQQGYIVRAYDVVTKKRINQI